MAATSPVSLPTDTHRAGADAAGAYGDPFRDYIANDPEIQRVIQGVWGQTPVNARPSDTPKNLEAANAQASKAIGAILESRGIKLPDRTFINPRSGALEGARGWSGLNNWQRTALIAAAAATGVGGAAALGAFGGAAGGAAAAGGTAASGGGFTAGAVTSGIGATLPGAAIAAPTAAGLGGIGTGASFGAAALHGAELGALNGGLQGGVKNGWKGALTGAITGAGTGAATGGLGGGAASGAGKMGWSDALLSAAGGQSASGGVNWAGLAQTGLGVAGALAQGQQGQRATDTGNILTRDSQGINAQAQNDNARAQAADVEMRQKEAERAALNDAYKNAIRSSLALNMQDAKFARPDGVPDFSMSGGARPSALGAEGKQAAGLMNAKALEELLNPGKLTALPMPSAYSLTDLPKAGAMENVLGAAGTVGKVLEANQARTDAAKQSDLIKQLLASSQQRAQAPMQEHPITTGGTGMGPTNWADAIRF